MIAKPNRKCFPIEFAGRHLQYHSFLFIYRGLNLNVIEKQKDLHSCMSGTFVAV